MIIEIGSPGLLITRWRNVIQQAHANYFLNPMTDNILEHWWFADFDDSHITGIAGAKHERDGALFLGPCIVFEQFRGRGIQREFIKHRERLANNMDTYEEILTYTNLRNYPSSNNLIRCGFALIPAWDAYLKDDGSFLYWRKGLEG